MADVAHLFMGNIDRSEYVLRSSLFPSSVAFMLTIAKTGRIPFLERQLEFLEPRNSQVP